MSLLIPIKKRSSLESIVGKLSQDVASQKLLEVVADASEQQVEEATVLEQDLYLVPPCPSSPPDDVVLSEPVSPSVSEDGSYDDQSDTKEEEEVIKKEEKESRKSIPMTVHRKRSSLGGFLSKASDHIPKAPMRCDVCGLRVYKSYRYISRTSAPLHLKSFVTSGVDRFRVCKRCFSSRERCRQNLALILLKSKTSQMMHLRTPLGVTNTRATKGIEYIVRDLKDKLKRPYDDLMCDETLLDEDQMSNEGFEETEEKSSEPTMKVVVVENGSLQREVITTTPLSSKNIGLVTLVRPQSGVFNSTPNCFTLYGEIDNMRMEGDGSKESRKEAQASSPETGMPEKTTEVRDKKMMNGGLSIEINSINNKLTLLDHAYALPPPKSKASVAKNAAAVTKPAKTNDVKVPKSSPAKSASQPVIKKETSEDQVASTLRTCGIVCSLCDNLVTKSYSCYNKDNAPDKVQHLFIDGTKVVKVCRRCCPYKKPKVEDDGKVHKKPGKLIKGKLVKAKKMSKTKTVKAACGKLIIKPTDSGNKGKSGKNANSPQGTKPQVPGSPVENAQKDGTDDEKNGTEISKNSVLKVSSAGSQTEKSNKCSAKKQKVEKVSPESKTSSKLTQSTMKTRKVGKEEGKVVEVTDDQHKSGTAKGGGQSTKCQVPDKTKTRERSVSPQEQEDDVKGSETLHEEDKPGKMTESGTQSSCSLIGVKMKSKPHVASAEKDAQTSGDKENLKASKSVKREKEDAVPEMEVEALASDSSHDILCDMSKDAKKRPDTTAIPKEKTATTKIKAEVEEEEKEEGKEKAQTNETKEGKSEEIKEETIQGLKGKEKEGAKKQVKEAKKGHAKETVPELVVKIKTANPEKCKEDETTKNEVTAPKPAEQKPKDKTEIKNEVSSPRRGRNTSAPGRRKDTEKSVVPTVMTRKRLASLSETEIEASKQGDEPVTKRKALAVIRDRVLKKKAEPDEVSAYSGDKPAQQGGKDSQSSSTDSSETDEKASLQTLGQKNDVLIKVEGDESTDDSSNKAKVQSPIKCASCDHRVVKSYRCIQRDASPDHVKPLFKDASEMLRICRRCLKPGQGKLRS